MTGSVADAEDLAQETFIRAYEQIGSFHGGAKFSTWLYSIAVHACLNWRRDEARRFQAHADCAEEISARHSNGEISRRMKSAQAGAGGADEIAGETARGDRADDLRRIESRGSGESFALFGNDRFLARFRRETEIETLAHRRSNEPMNDFELESKLKSIPLPERTAEYWKIFHRSVRDAVAYALLSGEHRKERLLLRNWSGRADWPLPVWF